MRSTVFQVTDVPPAREDGNHHAGVDALLALLESGGWNLYDHIAPADVVLVKVNAQWQFRGQTNTDVVRGIVQRVLEHPAGFRGEVVIIENGQDRGSFDSIVPHQGVTGPQANAEDPSHSFSWILEEVYGDDPRVSGYLLDDLSSSWIGPDEHARDGYRELPGGPVSYPAFTTRQGTRVELREGVWNGTAYEDRIKLINVPVLKHHGGSGTTGAVKHVYGLLSMARGDHAARHYSRLGEHCGLMLTRVRTPIINILDCTWVSHANLAGTPPETTTRVDRLLASTDPVALDYWAAKHVLYPIDRNPEHDPDSFPGLRDDHLGLARTTINANGGIFGAPTQLGDANIRLITARA